LHAGQCGQVAREAGVRKLILSHFYPITERHDVKAQAGETFGGMISKARDLLQIKI
jgi:ribonuclease BN (tRNA processing enzyme)